MSQSKPRIWSSKEKAIEYAVFFVENITIKLIYFDSILNDKIVHDEISKEIKEKGEILGGVVGGLLSIFTPVPEGILSYLIKAVGEMLKTPEGENYKNKIANLAEFIQTFMQNDQAFIKMVAEIGIDIFCSYEMQFTNVDSKQGIYYALNNLAKDAAYRACQFMINEKCTSMEVGILKGKSKGRWKWGIRKGGYDVLFNLDNFPIECKSSDLYSKLGIIREENGQKVFMKQKKDKSLKYGYRLSPKEKDWDVIKDEYMKDTEAENKNKKFSNFLYKLNSDRNELIQEVIKKLKEKKALDKEELFKILQETYKQLSKEFERIQEELNKIRDDTKNIKQAISKLQKQSLAKLDEIKDTLTSIDQKVDTINKKIDNMAQDMKEIKQAKTPENSRSLVDNLMWFNVPKYHKSDFYGRETELKNIYESLHGSNSKIKPICITGLGGIGKTELAKAYAYEKRLDTYQNNVIWINAENESSVRESFLNFAELKFPELTSRYKKMNTKEVIMDIYMRLGEKPCLFIFDNVDCFTSFNELDPSMPEGHTCPYILITSQIQDWPEDIKVINLEGFKGRVAINFLRKKLFPPIQDNSSDEELLELVEELDCFPLALQQAVSVINRENRKTLTLDSIPEKVKNYAQKALRSVRFGIKDYIRLFRRQPKKYLDAALPHAGKEMKTTFTALNITLQKMMKEEYGKISVEILEIISYCRPQNIDFKMFGILNSNDVLNEVLLNLDRYSIIKEGSNRIHRLIQKVMRANIEEKREEEVLSKACELICNKINESGKELKYENILHFASIWKYGDKFKEIVNSFSDLAIWIQDALINLGKLEEAVEINRTTVYAWKIHNIFPDIQKTYDTFKWTAINPSITAIKRIDYALERHEKTLDSTKEGKSDEADGKRNLETDLIKIKGLRDKIKNCNEQISESDLLEHKVFEENCKKFWGDKHTLTFYALFCRTDALKTYVMQAKRKASQNKNKSIHSYDMRSDPFYQEALDSYESLFHKTGELLGFENWFPYDAMTQLSRLLEVGEDYERALNIYEEFLTRCHPAHPHAVIVNIKIAKLKEVTNPDESLKIYEKLLKWVNLNDEDYADILCKKAKLLQKRGDPKKALDIYKGMLKDRRKYTKQIILKTNEAIVILLAAKKKKTSEQKEELLKFHRDILIQKNELYSSDIGKISKSNIKPTMISIKSLLKDLDRHEEVIKIYQDQLENVAILDSLQARLLRLWILNEIAHTYEDTKEYSKSFEILIQHHELEKKSMNLSKVSLDILDRIVTIGTDKIERRDSAVSCYLKFYDECVNKMEQLELAEDKERKLYQEKKQHLDRTMKDKNFGGEA